ncbi:Hypothetical predicted protein [Paramuricea clavata]|uniref:Uncharacterized protein n=1 Tax=Paramuricea clavata TaxID=317549 RepID=A0A7D9J2M9_PARCT|nr:Hypothetical predicted protein [Paramuricea clavata]
MTSESRKNIFLKALNKTVTDIKSHTLKPEQQEWIRRLICCGEDVLAVLPTGFGKGVVYQLLPTVYQNLHLLETGEMKHFMIVVLWSILGSSRFLFGVLRSIGVLSQHDVEVGCTVSSSGSEKGAKKEFPECPLNWTGVGLSLSPPCCLIVPKKFSKGYSMCDVFSLTAHRSFLVVCNVELLKQSKMEPNLESSSAVPIADEGRPPTLT